MNVMTYKANVGCGTGTGTGTGSFDGRLTVELDVHACVHEGGKTDLSVVMKQRNPRLWRCKETWYDCNSKYLLLDKSSLLAESLAPTSSPQTNKGMVRIPITVCEVTKWNPVDRPNRPSVLRSNDDGNSNLVRNP